MKIKWLNRFVCATFVIFSGVALCDAELLHLFAANDMATSRCINKVQTLNNPGKLSVACESPDTGKVILLATAPTGNPKRGIMAFSFDDGYASWLRIAQILKKYDGFATGYVNNWKLDKGDINASLLRTLQDSYGWEIGTHTYAHANAEPFVLLYGKDRWLQDELVRSISQLSDLGLRIRSLVFPFNKSTGELRRAVLGHVSSFRDADDQPLSEGIRQDGSFSGRALDAGDYVPIVQVKKWIDQAQQEGKVLLIYGHQVLPDSEFRTGIVQSVTNGELIAVEQLEPFSGQGVCLVPDINRSFEFMILIKKIEGHRVISSKSNLSAMTVPGARFMIGSCTGLRESDFEAIVSYAAPRLEFRRISDLPRLR